MNLAYYPCASVTQIFPLPRCANQENMGATNSLTWVIQNSKVAAIIGIVFLKLDDWRRDIYPSL